MGTHPAEHLTQDTRHLHLFAVMTFGRSSFSSRGAVGMGAGAAMGASRLGMGGAMMSGKAGSVYGGAGGYGRPHILLLCHGWRIRPWRWRWRWRIRPWRWRWWRFRPRRWRWWRFRPRRWRWRWCSRGGGRQREDGDAEPESPSGFVL